jgi:hypothetical protein
MLARSAKTQPCEMPSRPVAYLTDVEFLNITFFTLDDVRDVHVGFWP